jgi:hemerythrin-like metal-binding protein
MLLGKHSVPEVAIDFMNRDHQIFIDLVVELQRLLSVNTDPSALTAALEELQLHTASHFAEEEVHMLDACFPPYLIHQQEHKQVLADLQAKIEVWKSGQDKAQLKKYVQEDLPAWLSHHVQSMDYVTANWLARTNTGIRE